MCSSAEQGEWDALTGIESQRNELVSEIRTISMSVVLDSAETKVRDDLISRILAHERVVTRLVSAHMDQLQTGLSSRQNTRRIRQAYGV